MNCQIYIMLCVILGVILLIGTLALVVIFAICQAVGKDWRKK